MPGANAAGERGKLMRGEQQPLAKLSPFAREVWREWQRLVLPASVGRLIVAASGGADSCALLLAVDELLKARRLAAGVCVVVAHLDHGLRGAAGAADARWVAELARRLGYECASGRASVAGRARRERDNLEQAARGERYEFLGRVARARGAGVVLTGHTLDDQAETVVLALLRGSGAAGLGGMSPVRTLDERGDVQLARPLLGWARRAGTAAYCREQGIEPRVDAMNEDESFKRVRVRRQLLPLLETLNPRAVEALARAAGLLRDDSAALDEETAKLLAEAARDPKLKLEKAAHASDVVAAGDGNKVAPLSVEVLRGANVAVRRRALRQWIKAGRGHLRRVELVHVLAIEKLLEGERGGRVAELPGACEIVRRRGRLWLRVKEP